MNFLRENKGFVLGLILALFIFSLPTPDGLSLEAHRTAAIFLLMGTWWATEAVSVAVTALVPLALFPLLGVVDIQSAADPYANKTIYLFFGGFLIATAIQKWDLHKRIALFVLENAGNLTGVMKLIFEVVWNCFSLEDRFRLKLQHSFQYVLIAGQQKCCRSILSFFVVENCFIYAHDA